MTATTFICLIAFFSSFCVAWKRDCTKKNGLLRVFGVVFSYLLMLFRGIPPVLLYNRSGMGYRLGQTGIGMKNEHFTFSQQCSCSIRPYM